MSLTKINCQKLFNIKKKFNIPKNVKDKNYFFKNMIKAKLDYIKYIFQVIFYNIKLIIFKILYKHLIFNHSN